MRVFLKHFCFSSIYQFISWTIITSHCSPFVPVGGANIKPLFQWAANLHSLPNSEKHTTCTLRMNIPQKSGPHDSSGQCQLFALSPRGTLAGTLSVVFAVSRPETLCPAEGRCSSRVRGNKLVLRQPLHFLLFDVLTPPNELRPRQNESGRTSPALFVEAAAAAVALKQTLPVVLMVVAVTFAVSVIGDGRSVN